MSQVQKNGQVVGAQTKLRHGKRKGLSTRGKILIATVVSLGVLLIAGIIGGAIWLVNTFGYQYDPLTKDPNELGVDESIDYPDEITNIALFGLDSRAKKQEGAEYQQGLSDSIMIISINSSTGSIKLVSVMRDSLVNVEGHGYQKINAAYSIGGPLLAVKTLNQTYRLNIKDYAIVDFEGMVEIVDAVGGIELELTPAEIHYTNAGIEEIARVRGLKPTYVSKAGKQPMNGLQAVSFSRIRYVPTINGTRDDYGRTERQRLVMTRLFEKALDLPLTQYPSLIRTILPYVQTSLGYDDIFKLAKVLKADGVSMQQGRIPLDECVITGGLNVPHIGSCVYYDLEYSADLLNAFFFEDISFEAYMAQHGVWKHNWYGAVGYGDVYIHPDGTVEKGPIKGGSSVSTATTDKTSEGTSSDLTSDSMDLTDVTDVTDTDFPTDTPTDSTDSAIDSGGSTDSDGGGSEESSDSSENSETEHE